MALIRGSLRNMLYTRRTLCAALALFGSSAYLLDAAASNVAAPSDFSAQRQLHDPVGYILNQMSIQIIVILIMLLFSSYLTGLNIGLLSLDKFDMLILIYSGTKSERYYAGTLLKFLIHKHQSLLTILVIKTFCEALFTLLLDNLISQIVAPGATILITAITSSLVLLTFGEIIPQSLFLQFGMKMSSRTRYFFYMLWYLTYPLSFPGSLILDSFIGSDKPKNSNQILSMRELFQQIIENGNEQHIKLLLYGLGIKDSIKPFINEEFAVLKEKDLDKSTASGLGNTDMFHASPMSRFTIFLRDSKTPSKYIENDITALQFKSPDITFTTSPPDNYNLSINSYSGSPKGPSTPQFVVAEPKSKISKVLSEMHSRNINCAIIFQKSAYVPNRIIGGYILREELIEQLFSNMDDCDLNNLEKSLKYPVIEIDKQPSPTNSPIILENSPNLATVQSYTADSKSIQVSKGRAQWLKFLVSKIARSKCLPMPVDTEKLKNVLAQDFLLCSVNDTNFSHPHLMLKHTKPSQIVILTIQGYLPISINYADGQTQNGGANAMKVYVPPMTLLGHQFIDDLRILISGLDSNQLQDDKTLKEIASTSLYQPQFTVELCKKGHYATYLVLTANQLVKLLAP